MADSPGTGISILQILSVPALLAAITGVGSFLKSLWDKWSERRSLIGLQKLTDYLDLDSKRDTPLLTRQTRELIDYEVNLKFREFAGTPAHDAIEKIERWRRRPYLVRALWIPSEIAQSGVTLILPRIIAFYLSLLSLAYFFKYVYGVSTFRQSQLVFQNINVLLAMFVLVASLSLFSRWAALLAKSDLKARDFVKKNSVQEMACVKDDC